MSGGAEVASVVDGGVVGCGEMEVVARATVGRNHISTVAGVQGWGFLWARGGWDAGRAREERKVPI